MSFTTRDGLADNNVFSIFEDSNNNLWFSTNDGAWNRDGDSLSFTIKPVFYKTTIFKIALLFVFLAFVAAEYSWYKKRPAKEEKKHKTSSLNPIFEMVFGTGK